MATSKWWIKRGDTLPILTAALTDKASGAAVNLTSVTGVQLTLLRKTDSTGAPITGASPVERVGTVVGDPTTGTVSYSFVAGDWTGGTALPSGTYEAEWELTYNSGAIRTVPTEGYCYVIVGEDLDT